MMEDRIRRDIDLKIKIINNTRCPRHILMNMLRLFQEEDEEVMLIKEAERYQEGQEIPAGKEFIETFRVDENKNGHVYMHVTVRTKKTMGELKWGNEGKTMKWMTEHKIFVQLDR